MNKKQLNAPITCQGLTIRTSNADEMTAGKETSAAKIGGLWQDFQTKFGSMMNENTQVYGIYHNYESDVDGLFDVTACIADLQSDDNNLNSVTIPTGNYLVFQQQGEMPQAVIDAWGAVWAYFTSEKCEHKRKYNTDFEKYIGMNEIEVWIGIE